MDANSPSPPQVYQLRIHLRGISPPVWRRIWVCAKCTIAQLHAAIQAAMGWSDDHLHGFTIRGQWCDGSDFYRLRLADFDLRLHERFIDEYDFHSNWVHDIRVEKILSRVSVLEVPVCTAGFGACPPEDSGPPDRFMATFDEHSEWDLIEWLEEALERPDFDRATFRESLADWQQWFDRRFDRQAANARLRGR